MRAPKTHTGIRQEQIVEAALELIGQQGAYALSIAGIAERVGIVPSAIYRHFKSKDDLLDAILELLRKRLMTNVKRVRKETPEAIQRLKLLLTRHARMVNENQAIPYVVFSDAIYTGHPERKARVAQIITGYLREIQKIIENGRQEGTIRKDIDTHTTAVMFLGMIFPAAVLRNVTEGRFDMVNHVENAWPVFAGGIEVCR